MTRKKVIFIGIFFSLTLLAIGGYLFLYNPQNTVYLEAEYSFDITDKKLLVSWADNVYVGIVMKKVKEYKDEVSPVTVYDVIVEDNLKGNLSGRVQISHRIGYDKVKKALFKFEGDNFLEAKTRYLFVSKYDPTTHSHWIVPVVGNIALKTGDVQLKNKERKRADASFP